MRLKYIHPELWVTSSQGEVMHEPEYMRGLSLSLLQLGVSTSIFLSRALWVLKATFGRQNAI
jgi:hypothetical protein